MAAVFLLAVQRALGRDSMRMIFFIISVLLIYQIECKPLCKPGYYYDEVTGNCDHCSDICEQAKEQGTTEICLRKCPGYKQKNKEKGKRCPPFEYYDDNVERCDSCASVCQHIGDLKTCKDICPDWHRIEVKAKGSKRNDSLGHSSEHEDMNKTPVFGGNTNNILIALAVLLLPVGLAVVLFLHVYKRCQYRKKAERNVGSPNCSKRPHQPIQRDSHEMESLTGRGDPLSHPEDTAG